MRAVEVSKVLEGGRERGMDGSGGLYWKFVVLWYCVVCSPLAWCPTNKSLKVYIK